MTPVPRVDREGPRPYYADEWLTVLEGDCREVMRGMEPESVHCVVTSPPYWGLRDYGTATWEGGDAGCDHRMKNPVVDQRTSTLGPNGAGLGLDNSAYQHGKAFKDRCGKCGATRIDAQLGLEPTPEEYVAALVDVFREVRRVLRADGTVWLNLGDSYFGTGKGPTHPTGLHSGGNGTGYPVSGVYRHPSLKEKDLVGIPWRVAFALQADGWYLRSDIIWAKPNPMPESVTDRPTKAHEYVFLLSKSARYLWDAAAVAEPATREGDLPGGQGGHIEYTSGGHNKDGLRANGLRPVAPTRNLRSVWTIATAPYPGAHFATFPPRLVEPCIKAGTSERGVCPECGAPWERVVEREQLVPWSERKANGADAGSLVTGHNASHGAGMSHTLGSRSQTTGWRPTCRHTADPVPATVLDIFAGTGTVGLVAAALSRRAVLIDLNAEYLRQCLDRNRQMPLGVA